MKATGSFEIKLSPQSEDGFPAGRMTIDKQYLGDMKGTGKGQMISKRTDGGAAVYYAIEEFAGSINDKTGSFTLVHQGHMSASSQTLKVEILEGSGGGDLQGIAGSLSINQVEEGHTYELDYQLESA